MPALFQYQQVPGGQEERSGEPVRSSGTAYRRRHRQGALWSGVLAGIAVIVLVVVFKRHPEWREPVGELGQALSASDSNVDSSDALPRINWSWGDEGNWLFARPPKIGSAAWLKRYPGFVHGPEPKTTWLNRYTAAKLQGLIPDIPKAELVGGLANYPEGLAIDEHLCSYRRAACIGHDDIYRAPTASWAINFDDGPLPPSAALYEALDAWDEKATHFWVGNNVKENYQLAVQAADRGDHLAVHTWSHPHLTTYTNEEIVGELGWTMQIIHDISTHVPKYYRPPFGDVDNRVRAIAQHVFGMRCILWNYDSFDWSLNQTWATGDFVDPPYDWLTTNMSITRLTDRMADNDPVNGEGVIVLEHELSFESVRAFTESYPNLAREQWRSGTVPDLLDISWYQT